MAGGAGLGEAAVGEDVVDGDGETDFGVFLLGVGEAEIGEDIAELLKIGILPLFLGMAFLGMACLIFGASCAQPLRD
ncbi:MAG TPA: hypothetical protein VFF95_14110, partial [Candidatus Binatus sp.]|nr:hypothetical protein [Candidatus Binatus sp.]